MTSPSVSIVIATKNASAYFRPCVDSIRQQDNENLEAIVVDGGSTDDTVVVAQDLPNLRLFRQSGDNIADAWNQGIDAARGDFIAFIDSDDLWPAHKISSQLAAFERDPALQYVIGHVRHFMEPGQDVPPGFKQELLNGDVVGRIPGTMMARAGLFSTVGDFDTTIDVALDVDWFVRAEDQGVPMTILDDVLLFKRVHGSNWSNQAERNTTELLRVLRASVKRKNESGPGRPGRR